MKITVCHKVEKWLWVIEYLVDWYSQLEQILEIRRRLLGAVHIATGEVQFTLGLFELYLLGNEEVSETFVATAHKSYESQLGANHPSTIHVAACLDLISQRIADKINNIVGQSHN